MNQENPVDNGSDSEPQRKKARLRVHPCPSDLSADCDPLIVSDSGFGDLGSCKYVHHGDSEVSSFFPLGPTSELFDDTNHSLCGNRTKSIDTLSLATEEFSDVIDQEDEDHQPPNRLQLQAVEEDICQQNTSSSSSDPFYSTGDSFSASSGRSSSRSSSTASGNNSSSSCDDDTDLDNWAAGLLSHASVSCSPSKVMVLQRFLSHLKSNPNDVHIHEIASLLLSQPEFVQRHRLRHVTTIQDAARLLRCSKKVLVLTGAGISVSCGIPDFRSKDGLYARVSKVFPHLKDPQSIFDIRLFRRDPRPFFLTAKELYPGQFEPSLSHSFIKKLEMRGQLLRNYSQNIDTLETIVGINKVTMCHGSFATATCIRCGFRVQADDIKEKVLAGEVPFCPTCSNPEEANKIQFPLTGEPTESGEAARRRLSFSDDEDDMFSTFADPSPLPPVLKPDIVFFGEDLPDEFHSNLQLDKPDCDLLLVIGSSLRVRPVSLIPGMLPIEVPQILINRESLPHCRFDVELLGNCDNIIAHLCRHMGPEFSDLAATENLSEVDKLPKDEVDNCNNDENEVPKSEHDIQALKACWEPKVNEKIVDKLPEKSYLAWRPRQYIFEGAEEVYDPDDDDNDSDSDSSSSSSDSDSSEADGEVEKSNDQEQSAKEATASSPSGDASPTINPDRTL